MSVSLNPTIPTRFSMYIPSLEVLAYTIPEKTVTPIHLEKKEKWINKGKNKDREPDF